MCQMYGPSCFVVCVKCGESFREGYPHQCKAKKESRHSDWGFADVFYPSKRRGKRAKKN